MRDHLALWAGVTALCTNLAALNLLALLGDGNNRGLEALAALITAIASAAAVFAKQKLDDEKAKRASRSERNDLRHD